MKKLIITDPCYLIEQEEWAECCQKLNDSDEKQADFLAAVKQKLLENSNIKAVIKIDNTPYGDGSYFVQPISSLARSRNFEFWIDSGIFAICEVKEFDENEDGIARLEFDDEPLQNKALSPMVYSNFPDRLYLVDSIAKPVAVIDWEHEEPQDEDEDDTADELADED